ncbi:Hypothetical predicted protein [Mytilus galloprovincialis]|uniref:Uncharacterized protein n=1 Tax=Mytilus galloprovincialis TaxID=29158 RepID=A0A8B6HN66_MYTGA|nr:Hypothetical predicted protein [Mytilus galloprovincialis]
MVGNIVLVFISHSVLAGLIYADELTWIQSASSCTLANQQEIETANAAYPPSWIGGYFLTTTWVAYLEISVIHDNYYTFAAAQKKCTILDYYPVKNSPSLQNILLEGKSYWTNVLRFSTKLLVDNTTDINALKASQRIGYPPAVRKLPCNNVLPFRCSPAYTPAVTADALNTAIPRKTTYDSLGTFPEATSESYNTTDSNGNGHEKFEDNDEIDRTRITEVFIIIIGITAFLSILIISSAIFVLYLYRQKRKQYSLEIQDQNAIKTRRDLYFATEDICNDYLGLQWIPSESDIKRLSMQTLNTDNSAYTTLNSAGKDISTNNVNTENATNLTVKSNEQVSTKQKVNSENATHTGLPTIRPVSSPKYATSTVTKSARLGSSIGKANNKNAAYTGLTLIRHIPSNKVDIDPGIETKSEYDHLDYTLKSDEKCSIDGNEPNRTKQKETDIVYEDPWEEENSKFQRAFSQIRQGMVHRGRSIRKSILKRQSRIRGNDAYTVTELSVDNFVYDSPKAENPNEDVAENIIEGKDMHNKAEAMDDVSQCTLRNKVNRQSKCAKPDTRRSSVKLTFQRMFSLKTFKTPASFQQSDITNTTEDCV